MSIADSLIYPTIFLTGGLIGWTLDTAYRYLTESRYAPGTLVPYFSLIYGAGAMVLYSFFSIPSIPFVWDLVIGMILCVLLELTGGYISITLLRRRLWDYRSNWGNFYGYIDPLHSFYWLIFAEKITPLAGADSASATPPVA